MNYKINLNNPCFDGYNKIELTLPNNWKFKQKDGKMFGVRKQYPKTYEECKLLLQTNCTIPSIPGYREYEIALFQELLICRDAYWKIADNWKPHWNNDNQFKYIITCRRNNIIKDTYTAKNCIFVFPTEEMRDAFFENFKDLIEKCKEFL